MSTETHFKNCQKCQGIFTDKHYKICWVCRKEDSEKKLKNTYKQCSGCRNMIKIDNYPLSRCPNCLEKIRNKRLEKMDVKKAKCSFIDEKSVKCILGTLPDTEYCKKHTMILINNNVSVKNIIYDKKDEKIDDEKIMKSLDKLGKNRKITDDQIREILKLKDDGLSIVSIMKSTGLPRFNVEDVYHGRMKPLDETSKDEMVDILKKKYIQKNKIKQMKNNMSESEFHTEINKNQCKKHRKISVEDMIEIILLKKTILISVGSKTPRNIFPLETIKIVDPEGTKKITIDMVKNLWAGRSKMYEDDFDNQKITFSDYQELLNVDRKLLLSD